MAFFRLRVGPDFDLRGSRFEPRCCNAALLLIFMFALGRLVGRAAAKLLTDRSKLTNEHLIRYIVFTNKAGLITTSNAVKIACWQALNEAGLTFSSDVSSGIDIISTPELNLSVNKMEKHDRTT